MSKQTERAKSNSTNERRQGEEEVKTYEPVQLTGEYKSPKHVRTPSLDTIAKSTKKKINLSSVQKQRIGVLHMKHVNPYLQQPNEYKP